MNGTLNPGSNVLHGQFMQESTACLHMLSLKTMSMQSPKLETA